MNGPIEPVTLWNVCGDTRPVSAGPGDDELVAGDGELQGERVDAGVGRSGGDHGVGIVRLRSELQVPVSGERARGAQDLGGRFVDQGDGHGAPDGDGEPTDGADGDEP